MLERASHLLAIQIHDAALGLCGRAHLHKAHLQAAAPRMCHVVLAQSGRKLFQLQAHYSAAYVLVRYRCAAPKQQAGSSASERVSASRQ